MSHVLTSPVYVCADNIDTDQIIPAQYLTLVPTIPEEYEKLGSYALIGLPDARYPTRFVDPGEMKSRYKIVIAGRNFGCGSSREHGSAAAPRNWPSSAERNPKNHFARPMSSITWGAPSATCAQRFIEVEDAVRLRAPKASPASWMHRLAVPKGLYHPAQGCEERATRGLRKKIANSEGVAAGNAN